ncbi:hypothetical protein JKP88DRAFT_261645 [Tribonema minus]|uniref:Ricin B lectin domain-containing protein n=1 Tax=Tribonema minus TaxID=303371 RepID=A0A836C8R7_9STRA|nr:hypothetical protein JKP88DRAFT_261645 [Tribonema minus]
MKAHCIGSIILFAFALLSVGVLSESNDSAATKHLRGGGRPAVLTSKTGRDLVDYDWVTGDVAFCMKNDQAGSCQMGLQQDSDWCYMQLVAEPNPSTSSLMAMWAGSGPLCDQWKWTGAAGTNGSYGSLVNVSADCGYDLINNSACIADIDTGVHLVACDGSDSQVWMLLAVASPGADSYQFINQGTGRALDYYVHDDSGRVSSYTPSNPVTANQQWYFETL